MRRSIVVAVTLLGVMLVASPAVAQRYVSGGTGRFDAVKRGVVELGFDNILLARLHSVSEASGDGTSSWNLTWVGGITPRYFVADNFALALNLDLFYGYQSQTTTTGGVDATTSASEMGFLGVVMANYYIRLGFGLFFKPGIGGGFFTGKRYIPSPTAGVTYTSTLTGGAGRVDLGFVYWATRHFNLKGGIDIIARGGKESAEASAAVDSETFISVDIGANIGVAYAF